jgi:N-hydroxyarylamine O-acetyltransferase
MLASYLARIGIDARGRTRDLALVSELQLAHLTTVPFENLDVFHRRGVSTDPAISTAKIVGRRRGGWCFELNGAFAWLLRALGFDAVNVSCRVCDDGTWGPDLDHCAVVVTIDGEPWFVDVGFGDCCMVPVPLRPGEHAGVPRAVELRAHGDRFVLAERFGDEWRDQLDIDPTPRTMDEFTPRSTFLQTEPGLMWTEKPFATRAVAADGSRVTLRHGVLRQRAGIAEPVDVDVHVGDANWRALLHEHFGLVDTPRRG